MGGKQMETLMLEMEFLFQKQVTDLPSGNHRWGEGDGSTRQDTQLYHIQVASLQGFGPENADLFCSFGQT